MSWELSRPQRAEPFLPISFLLLPTGYRKNCPGLMEVVTHVATRNLPQCHGVPAVSSTTRERKQLPTHTQINTHTYRHTTFIPATQAPIYALMYTKAMVTHPHQDTQANTHTHSNADIHTLIYTKTQMHTESNVLNIEPLFCDTLTRMQTSKFKHIHLHTHQPALTHVQRNFHSHTVQLRLLPIQLPRTPELYRPLHTPLSPCTSHMNTHSHTFRWPGVDLHFH